MIFSWHPLLISLFIVFVISLITQLVYYLFYYLAPAFYRHPDKSQGSDPVSVIICARNEEENLKNFLPAVLEQDYPDFEVIVVNDCSEDDSYNILGEYLKKYPNLRVSTIIKDPKFTHSKKFAQFIGIKAARNEIMIFTDADCKPVSAGWIKKISSRFDDETDFVLGYGGYFTKPGLLNRYIRYDTLSIAMQYLGMAIRRAPYMGVGRNLAYRRSMFFDKKGFGSHTHLASGDDDLFINANATGLNCTVEFRKESHTLSVPSSNLTEFYKQKKRHLTTAKYYKFRDKVLLIAEPATRLLFYFSFLILMLNLYLWPAVLAIFGVRMITQFTVFALAQKKFDEKGLLPFMPIFDILSPFINSAIYLGSQRQSTSKNRWD